MSHEGGGCLVSVLMPAYNSALLLNTAINSVLAQTEPRFELLVIDDCSTDETVRVVEERSRGDERIRLLQMPHNGGPAAARNLGLSSARGRWIALLDTDDAYEPGRLAQLLTLADATASDLVADNLLVLPDDGPAHPLIPAAVLPGPRHLTATEFILRNLGEPNAARVSFGFLKPMMRRDFLQRHQLQYEARNRFGEDFMLYLACLRAGARWWITPETLYRYTARAGSLTEVQSSSDLFRISQLEADFLGDPGVKDEAALIDALLRHKAKIDRSYYYRAFTDAIKHRQLGVAARLLGGSRMGRYYIAQEVGRQAPTILWKALRGGYSPRARRGADRAAGGG